MKWLLEDKNQESQLTGSRAPVVYLHYVIQPDASAKTKQRAAKSQ